MKTSTRKNFTPAIQAYILSVIESDDFESCDYFNKCETDQEKMAFLKARFFSEYGWKVECEGLQNSVRSWLQGLALNIDFSYYDIALRLMAWGILTGHETEAKKDKEVDLYWDRMACNIIKMFNKVK